MQASRVRRLIYIDYPIYKKKNGTKKYSHMVADSLYELHMFATSCGIGRHFYHSSSRLKHYDIPEDKFNTIVGMNNVLVVSSKEIVIKSKLMGE